MATPVGPVEPDPDDPDLWTEWYDDGDGEVAGDEGRGPGRFGWPIRLVALVAILGIVLLFVL
ncbi:MAG: hypothetical protein QOI56_991 [Actinomycetota bacterium]|nr:hypothetical protein [Actinomycetota bacterium]